MALTAKRLAFERLHWRLTRAYVIAAVGATLLTGLIAMIWLTYVFYFTHHTPDMWVTHARNSAPLLRGYLRTNPPQRREIAQWAEQERKVIRNSGQNNAGGPGTPLLTFSWYLNPSPRNIGIAVVDRAGLVVASTNLKGVADDKPLSPLLLPRDRILVARALANEPNDRLLGTTDRIGLISVAVPVLSSQGNVIGALYVRVKTLLSLTDWIVGFGSLVLCATIFIAFIATIFGTMFSYVTSRWLTERLQVMAVATTAWSRGDFAPTALELPADELGELGGRLNGMARDLSQLLALRQGMAVLEERSRLARDLHDTAKQQAFAAAMQIGAAREKLSTDPAAAQERLGQAAEIVARMQHDLARIVRELSGSLEDEVDAIALMKQRIRDWCRQFDIPADVDITLDAAPDRQISATLLAIVDEALSNVARHSRARNVTVRLKSIEIQDIGKEKTGLELTVTDDGRGFDTSAIDPDAGMGLRNMRDRARSLPDGTFDLRAAPGVGVHIVVQCSTAATPGPLLRGADTGATPTPLPRGADAGATPAMSRERRLSDD